MNNPYLKLSDDVFNAIKSLKKLNSENIYIKSLTRQEREDLEQMFRTVVNGFLNDLKNQNEESIIFTSYLSKMSKEYYKNNSYERMTDDYFMEQYHKMNIKEEN